MNFFDFFDFSGLSQNLAEALGFYAEGMLQSQKNGHLLIIFPFKSDEKMLISYILQSKYTTCNN